MVGDDIISSVLHTCIMTFKVIGVQSLVEAFCMFCFVREQQHTM